MQNSQASHRHEIVRQLRIDDADELAATVASKNRRYLQMDGGRLRGELVDLRLGGVQLFRERLNVGMRIEATQASELVSFAVVLPGPGALRFCGRALQPGGFVPVSVGQWEVCFERGIDYVGCILERDRFERAALDLYGRPVATAWHRSALRSADPAAVARLSGWMRSVLSGQTFPPKQLPDGMARQLETELLALTIVALAPAEAGARLEPAWLRRRAVRRALEYLESGPKPWPTIPELCRESGVSQRTLEYAFRDLLGVTPVRYLKLLRLNRVRRGLTRATPEHGTVTGVALQYGFSDLGRFAGEYRQLFGERPSDTLRRC